jgi:hypothetical protein
VSSSVDEAETWPGAERLAAESATRPSASALKMRVRVMGIVIE